MQKRGVAMSIDLESDLDGSLSMIILDQIYYN